MSRSLRAIALVLLVASCGGGLDGPPRNLNDACSIVKQRPNYLTAFKQTERRWGVPVHVQMAVVYQESKFDGDARTPMKYAAGVLPMGRVSSAYGYSQALDATWKEYIRGPGRGGAKRDNIRDASDFMGWYMNKTLEKNGVPLTNARHQYYAYHEGHTGYRRGTYKNKAWLVRVAGEVADRAEMYRFQLEKCARLR